MDVSIPVLIEALREGKDQPHMYRCRPVFALDLVESQDRKLERAIGRLRRQLGARLGSLARQLRHDTLARCAISPVCDTVRLKLRLDVRSEIIPLHLWVVVFRLGADSVGFCTSVPDLWFQIPLSVKAADHSEQILTDHLQKLAKQSDRGTGAVRHLSRPGETWINVIRLDVETGRQRQAREISPFALLTAKKEFDGREELIRTGRCLDALYPDDLERAFCRDHEVDELARLLDLPERRPILLLGTRLVGKTAIIHEVVRRRVETRDKAHAWKNNVWHLSPARLISGMMYVGQWESRLLAILAEALRTQQILYFDDVLGLYRAGITRDSSLSIADVLKRYIQARDVRILAEITPEAHDIWLERDRGLADQFQVIRVAEPDLETTYKMLLHHVRTAEQEHDCEIATPVVPTVIDMTRRYFPDASFPGKAVHFLRRVIAGRRDRSITEATLYTTCSEQTGLPNWILNASTHHHGPSILEELETHVMGQQDAVAAAADIMHIARARLGTPGRPISAMLLLGPTGVGKTHFAKMVTRAFFSSDDRLIRFDMSEYSSPSAASQLIGTFQDPDGLLTSAIRHQPFAVVLLDEIEKAHPDVFDLLLQVLGEGRLTDALGRTSDFTNAIIIMTSNLGAEQIAGAIGFVSDPLDRQRHYVRAAECFFRPEFVNRLDRIIPFRSLNRDEIRDIAGLQLRDLVSREGFVRRLVVLSVSEEAVDYIVDQGFDSELGARALKRAWQKHLMQPIADRLAAHGERQIIRVYRGPDKLLVYAVDLRDVEPLDIAARGLTHETVAHARERLNQLTGQINSRRCDHAVSVENLTDADLCYFALKVQLDQVREQVESLEEDAAARESRLTGPGLTTARSHGRTGIKSSIIGVGVRQHLLSSLIEHEIQQYLDEVFQSAALIGNEWEQAVWRMQREMSLLDAMVASVELPQRVLLLFRQLVRGARLPFSISAADDPGQQRSTVSASVETYVGRYVDLFPQEFGIEAQQLRGLEGQDQYITFVALTGIPALLLARTEEGIHLLHYKGETVLFQVQAIPVPDGMSLETAAQSVLGRMRKWRFDLERGTSGLADDPFPLGRVTRVVSLRGTIDLRSGLCVPPWAPHAEMREMMLTNL